MYRVDNANVGSPTRVDITGSTFPANGFTSCIAVNPDNADQVLVVFSNYSVYSLFYSTDGGTTWARVAGNLEQNANGTGNGPSLRWASILPVSDGTVYLVGTSTGLYSTDTLINNASVWTQQGPNSIGSAVVDMIDTRTQDGLVAVATHGSGLFSTHITSINDLNTGVQQNSIAVSLNIYPNPASDIINLKLPADIDKKNVQLTLSDEIGRIVWKKQFTVNDASIQISVQNLSQGMYYLNLIADRKSISAAFVKD